MATPLFGQFPGQVASVSLQNGPFFSALQMITDSNFHLRLFTRSPKFLRRFLKRQAVSAADQLEHGRVTFTGASR